MVLGPNFSFLPILFLPAHTTSSSGTSDSTAVSREGERTTSPTLEPTVVLHKVNRTYGPRYYLSAAIRHCAMSSAHSPSLLVLNKGQCINLKLHSEMPAASLISNEIRRSQFDRLGGVQAMAMAWDGCQPWGEHSSVSTNGINTHESTWMPTTQYPFMNLA